MGEPVIKEERDEELQLGCEDQLIQEQSRYEGVGIKKENDARSDNPTGFVSHQACCNSLGSQRLPVESEPSLSNEVSRSLAETEERSGCEADVKIQAEGCDYLANKEKYIPDDVDIYQKSYSSSDLGVGCLSQDGLEDLARDGGQEGEAAREERENVSTKSVNLIYKKPDFQKGSGIRETARKLALKAVGNIKEKKSSASVSEETSVQDSRYRIKSVSVDIDEEPRDTVRRKENIQASSRESEHDAVLARKSQVSVSEDAAVHESSLNSVSVDVNDSSMETSDACKQECGIDEPIAVKQIKTEADAKKMSESIATRPEIQVSLPPESSAMKPEIQASLTQIDSPHPGRIETLKAIQPKQTVAVETMTPAFPSNDVQLTHNLPVRQLIPGSTIVPYYLVIQGNTTQAMPVVAPHTTVPTVFSPPVVQQGLHVVPPAGAFGQNSFQTIPFQASAQNSFQITPFQAAQNFFQTTPYQAAQNSFQTTPFQAGQNSFQTTPFQASAQNSFQTTPFPASAQNSFQTTPFPAFGQNSFQTTAVQGLTSCAGTIVGIDPLTGGVHQNAAVTIRSSQRMHGLEIASEITPSQTVASQGVSFGGKPDIITPVTNGATSDPQTNMHSSKLHSLDTALGNVPPHMVASQAVSLLGQGNAVTPLTRSVKIVTMMPPWLNANSGGIKEKTVLSSAPVAKHPTLDSGLSTVSSMASSTFLPQNPQVSHLTVSGTNETQISSASAISPLTESNKSAPKTYSLLGMTRSNEEIHVVPEVTTVKPCSSTSESINQEGGRVISSSRETSKTGNIPKGLVSQQSPNILKKKPRTYKKKAMSDPSGTPVPSVSKKRVYKRKPKTTKEKMITMPYSSVKLEETEPLQTDEKTCDNPALDVFPVSLIRAFAPYGSEAVEEGGEQNNCVIPNKKKRTCKPASKGKGKGKEFSGKTSIKDTCIKSEDQQLASGELDNNQILNKADHVLDELIPVGNCDKPGSQQEEESEFEDSWDSSDDEYIKKKQRNKRGRDPDPCYDPGESEKDASDVNRTETDTDTDSDSEDEYGPKYLRSKDVFVAVGLVEFTFKQVYCLLIEEKSEGEFVCKNCGHSLESKREAMAHMLDHRPYKCLPCNETFPSSNTLRIHMRTHGVKFYCKHCSFSTLEEKKLGEHVKEKHAKEKLDKDEIRTESEYWHSWVCHICGMVFTQIKCYEDHMKDAHNSANDKREGDIECPICKSVCISLPVFKRHMLEHLGKYLFCTVKGCTYKTVAKAFLDNHMDNVHRERNHPCPFEGCSMKFIHRKGMDDHLNVVHYKIRKYKCNFCSKGFLAKKHLKVHTRIHTDLKPIECQHCDYRCRQHASLNWHMKKKHPDEEVIVKKFHDQTYGFKVGRKATKAKKKKLRSPSGKGEGGSAEGPVVKEKRQRGKRKRKAASKKSKETDEDSDDEPDVEAYDEVGRQPRSKRKRKTVSKRAADTDVDLEDEPDDEAGRQPRSKRKRNTASRRSKETFEDLEDEFDDKPVKQPRSKRKRKQASESEDTDEDSDDESDEEPGRRPRSTRKLTRKNV